MEFNNLITLIDLIGNNIKDEYKESLKINNIYAMVVIQLIIEEF